jgi:hypothetical protein
LDDPEEFPGEEDNEGVGNDIDSGAHAETHEGELDVLIGFTAPYCSVSKPRYLKDISHCLFSPSMKLLQETG